MPVSLDSTMTTAAGVALVAVRVRNTEPVARQITVENRLPGSVLPPRRHGVPEPGWSADGYTGVVGAHDDLALGYACRVTGACSDSDGEATAPGDTDASDTGFPAELVAVSAPSTGETNPLDDVLAALADHRPPPDAVGPAVGTARDPSESSGAVSAGSPADGSESDGAAAGESNSGGASPGGSTTREPRPAPATLPPGVIRYLDGADGRIARAETLASGSVSDATAVIDAGIGPVGLQELVALDARALGQIAERAESLAARAEVVDVPTSALERLA